MRKYLLLITLVFLSFVSLAGEPVLTGEMTQGSLIRGKVAPGATVWLNQRRLTVSKGGYFAFGFGRDDDLQHTLKWQLPEQALQQKVLTLSKREYKIQRIDGLPQKMVTPPKEVLEKISADAKQVREARALRADSVDFIENFIWPAQGPISGVYGSQRVLNGEKKRPHFGIDVAAPIGEPVYAPASGVITLFVADMYYSGGTMIIDHGHGISSTFLHLHKSHVKVGDVVEQGQLVAEIGDTGRVTGPHLDWRMNWHEKRVDPELLVPSRD